MTDWLPHAPGPADQMVQWMNDIFVGAMGENVSAPVSGIGAMMAVINSGILVVASALLIYNIIAGVAQSAHEGKILGKRWSSLWGPIRPVLGLSMLIPLPSGYCAVQGLVLTIAGLGVTVANTAWEAVITGVSSGTASIVQPYVPESAGAVKELLRREVCWQALDRQMQVMEVPSDVRATRITQSPAVPHIGTNSARWDYGPVCGTVTVTMPDQSAAGRTITVAIANQVQTLMGQMRPTARQLALAAMPGTGIETAPQPAPVNNWLLAHSRVVGEAVTRARSEHEAAARQRFLYQASQGGFVYAGSWYHTIARLNSEFMQAAQLRPETTGPNLQQLPELAGGQEVATALAAFDGWWRTYVQRPRVLETEVVLTTETDSTWERLISPGKWEWIYDQLAMDGTNPLAELTGFGHKLLGTAEAVILASTATYSVARSTEAAAQAGANIPVVGWAAGAPTAAAATVAASTLEYLKEFLFFILGGMVVAAGALAFWLPMIPYILWFVALLGYLVFLLEAVVASTLWAFAHVRMDGEGIAGDAGRTGYEMVFNLLTRPVLMVVGLVFGYLVFYVSAQFIGGTFYAAMRGAMGSHIVGLIGLLVLTVMFVYLFVLAANKSFSLIHVLPDRVAIWAGAGRGVQPLGEEGDMQRGQQVVVGGVVNKADNAVTTGRYQSRAGRRVADMQQSTGNNRFTVRDTIG